MSATRLALAIGNTLLLAACGSGTPTSTPVEKAEATPIALKQPGVGSDVTVTVLSVKQADHVGAAGYGPKAGPGETFVVVRYTIKNTGTKPLDSFNRPELALLDSNDQTYSEDTTAGILAAALNNDAQDAGSDLNPKVTANATAVWKLDKASFDKKTWRIVATLGGMGAKADAAVSWPMKADVEQPLTFALQ